MVCQVDSLQESLLFSLIILIMFILHWSLLKGIFEQTNPIHLNGVLELNNWYNLRLTGKNGWLRPWTCIFRENKMKKAPLPIIRLLVEI